MPSICQEILRNRNPNAAVKELTEADISCLMLDVRNYM